MFNQNILQHWLQVCFEISLNLAKHSSLLQKTSEHNPHAFLVNSILVSETGFLDGAIRFWNLERPSALTSEIVGI